MNWRTVVIAALVPLLLSGGCASVPSGGRVVFGRAAENADQINEPYVRLIPVRPKPEWGPRQIVAGFLAASASFDDGHAVAREYVVDSAQWEPGIRPAVTIFGKRQVPELVRQTGNRATVRIRGQQIGTIDPGGQYTADPKSIEVTFDLAKTREGRWRITGMPPEARNGLLLTSGDVDRVFRTVNLFFFAPDQHTLVPNGIFQPVVPRGDQPSHLIRALLDGPTSWLRPAVRTAFPAGTRLRGLSVAKDIATVDLTGHAREGSLERMSAQLTWTLRQLPGIKALRLRIGGRTVTPDGMSDVQPISAWQVNDPDGNSADQTAYVIGAAGHLSQLVQEQPQPIATGAGGRLVRPAVAPDYVQVAGLSADRRGVLVGALVSGNVNLRTLLESSESGSRFTPPSWDREGRLWTVEYTEDESWLWVREGRGQEPVRVQHWGLGGRQVLGFKVSRDGVRAAAIVNMDGRAEVQMGRIVRTAGGTDVGSFLPVSSEIGGVIDLAWRDYNTLAVLGRKNSDSQVLPYIVPVNGTAISSLGVGALGVPRTIAAAPNAPVLIGTLTSGKEQVCRQRQPRYQYSEWVCSIPATDPAYPR